LLTKSRMSEPLAHVIRSPEPTEVSGTVSQRFAPLRASPKTSRIRGNFCRRLAIRPRSLRTPRPHGGAGSRGRTRLWGEIPDMQGRYGEIARIRASRRDRAPRCGRFWGPARRVPWIREQGSRRRRSVISVKRAGILATAIAPSGHGSRPAILPPATVGSLPSRSRMSIENAQACSGTTGGQRRRGPSFHTLRGAR